MSETPAQPPSGQSAPVSTAQVLPLESGSGQSTSASTTAQMPPAVPPTLSNEALRRIVDELNLRMNAGSRPTSTLTLKRGRKKAQDLHQEVETDAQRRNNLVSMFILRLSTVYDQRPTYSGTC